MGYFTVVMNDGMTGDYAAIFITINTEFSFVNSFLFLLLDDFQARMNALYIS
jgi:hypothetical protein